MMPIPSGSFSLQLIALAAGAALFIWALNLEDKGAFLGKFFGFIITVLAFFAVAQTTYSSFRFWRQADNMYEVVQIQAEAAPVAQPAKPVHKKKS